MKKQPIIFRIILVLISFVLCVGLLLAVTAFSLTRSFSGLLGEPELRGILSGSDFASALAGEPDKGMIEEYAALPTAIEVFKENHKVIALEGMDEETAKEADEAANEALFKFIDDSAITLKRPGIAECVQEYCDAYFAYCQNAGVDTELKKNATYWVKLEKKQQIASVYGTYRVSDALFSNVRLGDMQVKIAVQGIEANLVQDYIKTRIMRVLYDRIAYDYYVGFGAYLSGGANEAGALAIEASDAETGCVLDRELLAPIVYEELLAIMDEQGFTRSDEKSAILQQMVESMMTDKLELQLAGEFTSYQELIARYVTDEKLAQTATGYIRTAVSQKTNNMLIVIIAALILSIAALRVCSNGGKKSVLRRFARVSAWAGAALTLSGGLLFLVGKWVRPVLSLLLGEETFAAMLKLGGMERLFADSLFDRIFSLVSQTGRQTLIHGGALLLLWVVICVITGIIALVRSRASKGLEATEMQPEQAEAQPEQAEIQPEQAEAQPEQAEVQPEQAEVQPEQAEVQPEQAEAQPEQAETPPEQAEVQPEQAETPPEQQESR